MPTCECWLCNIGELTWMRIMSYCTKLSIWGKLITPRNVKYVNGIEFISQGWHSINHPSIIIIEVSISKARSPSSTIIPLRCIANRMTWVEQIIFNYFSWNRVGSKTEWFFLWLKFILLQLIRDEFHQMKYNFII